MHKYRATFHFLLVLLIMFQAATASAQVYCRHGDQESQQGTSTGIVPGEMASHHQHHGDMKKMDGQEQSGCVCGFECSGTCMHACQGLTLLSDFDPTLPVKADIQLNLSTGFSVAGFTTLPLRPPAIS